MKIFHFILFGLFILSGCGESTVDKPKTQIDIKPRVRMIAGENQELFERIMTPSQTFDLNLKKDTLLECAGGTAIYLPERCFMNANGEAVTDNVKVEIVEALTPEDFFRNNLQTISGDKILESAGMIYIDATANGQSLAIAEGNSIRVEIPALSEGSEYKIFSGDFDAKGDINWTESGELDNEMIPLPLSEFDFHYFKNVETAFYSGFEYHDSVPINDPKFENTYIATEEFAQRFYSNYLDSMNYGEGGPIWPFELYNTLKYDDFYAQYGDPHFRDLRDYELQNYKLDNVILSFYLDNTDKPICFSDSFAYAYLRPREIKDSIAESHLYGYSGQYWSRCSESFRRFMKLRQRAVAHYDPKGIDMETSNAKEALIKKGYTESEANKQIKIHALRKNKIAQKRKRERLRAERNLAEFKIQSAYKIAFEVTKLGWINCDRFLDDPLAKPVEIAVKTTGDSLPFCDVTLFFPKRNLALKGHLEQDGSYHFTGNAAPYTKLPINEEVLVVAMSSKNGVPHFGLQKFTMKEKQDFDIKLEASTWEGVQDKLKGI